MTRRPIILLCAFLLLVAAPAAASEGFPVLGLSASPDSYVEEIEVEFGDSFTLYVFLMGPGGDPLPFDLGSLDWALLGSCCGGSPAIYVETIFSAEMEHDGSPDFSVVSTATTCVEDDFIVLAEVSFDWLYAPTTPEFNLGAASLSAALDCDGNPWILTGAPLRVIPSGITPAETVTWSDVKTTYR